MLINSRTEMKNKTPYEENIARHAKFCATFYERHFFYTISTLKVFNHLVGLVGDIVEITDEKHDDPVEDNVEDAEEIPDYNVGERANPPFFAEFIDNTANDELEYCLKVDIIWAIAVGIEEENE